MMYRKYCKHSTYTWLTLAVHIVLNIYSNVNCPNFGPYFRQAVKNKNSISKFTDYTNLDTVNDLLISKV